MADAWIKVKIMPKERKTNLKNIEKASEKVIAMNKGNNIKIEKEPIAFGINALIATFKREETLDTEDLLEYLREIDSVLSAEIIDFRREIG